MSNATDGLLADILAFIDEVNRGDAAAALARFTDDVCIVEALAPYRIDRRAFAAASSGTAGKTVPLTVSGHLSAVVNHPGTRRLLIHLKNLRSSRTAVRKSK